jgi:predicted nucleic acid-binding Zn ribbon protein
MPHMPTYEYFCEANGQTIEVSHRLSERLTSWGELCQRTGTAAGRTPARSPIRRLISAAAVLSGKGAGAAAEPASCDAGPACCGGGCGLPS